MPDNIYSIYATATLVLRDAWVGKGKLGAGTFNPEVSISFSLVLGPDNPIYDVAVSSWV